MGKQFVDAPIITDVETDVSLRQKVRSGFSDYASAISLLQDDIYKEIAGVRKSIINPSSTLAGCVALAPATATRNIILPTAVGATNLVLKAIASQTAKALEIQSSAGAVVGSITVAGVIASMTWQGVTVATGYGGTGLTSYTAGDTLYASATDTLAKLAKGTANQLYGMNAGATAPEWKAGTLTAAGALAGITTLNMSGAATIGGNIYSASGTGVFNNAVDNNRVVGYSATTLEFGADTNWTNAYYRIVSGAHNFLINTASRLTVADTLVTVVPAASFSSTLITASQAAIGGALVLANGLTVQGAIMSTTSQNGFVVDVSGTPTVTGRGGYFRFSTTAGAYTLADMNVIEAAEPVVGAGSAITNLRMLYVNSTAAVATNKYGLFIEAVAGGVTINRAIHTAGAGDVLLNYLAGTGTRLVTATSTGILGNATTVAGAYTWSGAAIFSSTVNIVGLTTGATANFAATVTGTASAGGTTAAFVSSSATPAFAWNETDQAADAKVWDVFAGAGIWTFRAVNDANSAARSVFAITRDFGGATPYKINSIAYGNASDNNTNIWLGTGLGTYGGAFTVTGALTASSTLAVTGISNFSARIGLGGAANGGAIIDVGIGTSAVGISGTTQYGILTRPLFGTDATTNMTTLDVRGKGADGTYTTTTQIGVRIESFVKGSVQTVTNAYGLFIDNVTHGGTLNYALYTNTGIVRFGDTTDASSSTVGGTVVVGGLAIAKKLFIGTALDVGTTSNLQGVVTLGAVPRFNGTNTTGAGTALLGANSPASTLSAPYTWIQVTTSDGSTAYAPVWK